MSSWAQDQDGSASPPAAPWPWPGGEAVRVYAPSKSNASVAICLIVRNETIYMDEWVDFHIALGFAPIFVYDNAGFPDIELLSWLERRKDVHQYVHIIHFPIAPVQQHAYERCLWQDALNETFAAMIDIDEFVVLKKHDNIVDFMEEHCDVNCGQISINWRTMGTSNETGYRPLPVTLRNVHVHTFKPLFKVIKAIVRPTYVADPMDWSHSVMLKRGHWIDTNGVVVPRIHSTTRNIRPPYIYPGPTDVALLYHYRFKSEEEFRVKSCVRGDSLKMRGVIPKCAHMSTSQNYPRHGEEYDDA
ncbi:hypothetical protein ACHAXR_000779, partial [Thalassiosira sp. AJA248-18]